MAGVHGLEHVQGLGATDLADDDADQFLVSGDATVQWPPPTSGPWAGVSIFQQRDVDDKKLQISGNGGTNFLGGAFVANSMQISGSGTLNIGDNSGGGSGDASVLLVE